ncbi:MAG TPA: DUF6799 domain-containing protein [Chitinophagaceae bacterium]|nr:DUF6799 domain-containing protein [Chitinophagaceae bacterium]
MKKLFLSLSIIAALASCGGSAEKQETAKTDSAGAASTVTPAPDTSAKVAAQPVKDSIMQFKGGKVLIMVGGTWADLSAPVTTSNGRKVSPNGEVSKSGKTKKLEEGMMIDKDGQLMDKDGKPLDNTGWE